MSKKLKGLLLALVLCLQVVVPVTKADAATVIYNNKTGYEGNYAYELWKDYGDTSMTLKGNGLFECWWENIGNVLFRKGVKWDCTKTYSQLGNITVNYGVDYQPNGNSYLCVYGWCRNPLVEYYIVDCWGTWRPPGATSKGTITVDGATYDVYETTRVNQPSIDGNTTFQQYWSVRQSKRTSGTISVTEHFKAWERMGMKMGLMYEAAFNVEGYQSSGWADVYKLDITVGGSGSSGGSSSGGSSSGSGDSASSAPGTNKGTEIECESMTKSGQYTGTISNPFNGVALYGNDDAVSTTVNFSSGTHDFSLRGASNGDELAEIDLYIGGEKKGTFYYGDANVAEYTIKNVSTGTGNKKVELRMTADTGSWDAYADCLIIGGSGVSVGGNSGSQGGNTSGGNQGGNTSGGNTGSTTGAVVKQCEDMTKSGQYTGNVSNPFNGVALYANDDAVSYTQNFTSGTSTFTLTGASNGDNMAQVDLYIGGQKKGTFYYGDANVADFVIENVSTGTGNQKVELKVTADDGKWDAFIDKLTISGGATSGSNTGNTGNSGNTGSNTGNSGNTGSNTGNTGNSGSTSTDNTKQCEDMTKSGQYTGNVSNPFNGVALYANDDAVSYTQYFAEGTHDFTLRGASNGDNMARVDLVIGNQNKGTFYFGDANIAEYTISNVSHGTGNQTVKLVVTADDGKWDAYIDSLTISPAGSVDTDNGSNAGNSGNSGNSGSSINPNGKMVALTFDDGPSSTTSQVLDILDKYDVKATFFLIGQNINGNTRSILERQNASGHELANHSYTHSDMTTMSWSSIQNEINQTNNLIKQYTGQTAKFFRPPYISVNNTMYSAIDMAFVQGTMHNDWDGSSSSSQIANSVTRGVKDGQVILLHDFQGNTATVNALPTIIENLKNQGYQFVTMSQLFQYKGKNANVDYKIWSNVYD
ncbi:MAG: glycoside hydrolase family 11 protein [Lachnospiraceae bacterium]|nr:glycoside hydrolase family 11 protein [Lachnospiraceae bacterium]